MCDENGKCKDRLLLEALLSVVKDMGAKGETNYAHTDVDQFFIEVLKGNTEAVHKALLMLMEASVFMNAISDTEVGQVVMMYRRKDSQGHITFDVSKAAFRLLDSTDPDKEFNLLDFILEQMKAYGIAEDVTGKQVISKPEMEAMKKRLSQAKLVH